jgi:hypothetical protein
LWTAIDRLRVLLSGKEIRPERDVAHASGGGQSASARLVKRCGDGSVVEFDCGRFDDWCVYVRRPRRERVAPRDVEYFSELKILHTQFPRLLNDFVTVFTATGKTIEAAVSERISQLAAQYPAPLRADIEVLLATLHAAMMAEENRTHAPLGKRIKRLGVHQVLVEGMAVEEAANFSRGKPWRELEQLCVARGF